MSQIKINQTFKRHSFILIISLLGIMTLVCFIIQAEKKNNDEAFDAVSKGDFKRLKELVGSGVDVNIKDGKQWTLLHYAAALNRPDFVTFLLQNKAEINSRNNLKWTPLHCAASFGHANLAKILLEYSADVNARTNYLSTPLHWAVFEGHTDVAEVLIEYHADVNAVNRLGSTPLHWGAFENRGELVKLLLENKGKVNIPNKAGTTPMHCAAAIGSPEIVKTLYNHHADVNAKGNYQRTPLHSAAIKYSHEQECIVRLNELKDKGREVTDSLLKHNNNMDDTVCVIRFLIDNGADPEIKDTKGKTPGDYVDNKVVGNLLGSE